VDDAVAAANAGLDLEMPKDDHFGKPLKKAIAEGKVPVAAVDEAVTRLMRQLFRFVGPDFEKGYDPQKIAGPEHAALAREVAQKGIVLLKNENGVLPLDSRKLKTLAVIGELASMKNLGDRGSSVVTPPYAISALEGLKKLLGAGVKIEFDPGKDMDRVRKIAGSADAALVFAGLTFKDEGEGHDRKGLPLSAEHALMIITAAGANPKCAVVLEGGSAITMAAWKDQVPAIIMAWYPGMEGGHAVAEVLFGEVNPSGKLPIVFPASEDQLDKFDDKSKTVVYGDYHGYRHFEKKGLEPLFPFGFGLSYTKYQYSNLKLESVAVPPGGNLVVTVDVKNIGDRGGEEVVQLYVAPPGRAVDRAPKELKAFARVALGPGEVKTVALVVAAQDLAYYDEAAANWKIESGDYTVLVGPSSRNADLLKAAFQTG
jgi:beta-glucosidase